MHRTGFPNTVPPRSQDAWGPAKIILTVTLVFCAFVTVIAVYTSKIQAARAAAQSQSVANSKTSWPPPADVAATNANATLTGSSWPSSYNLLKWTLGCYGKAADTLSNLGTPTFRIAQTVGAGQPRSFISYRWEGRTTEPGSHGPFFQITALVNLSTKKVVSVASYSGSSDDGQAPAFPLVRSILGVDSQPDKEYYYGSPDYQIVGRFKLSNGDIALVGGNCHGAPSVVRTESTDFGTGAAATRYAKASGFSWDDVRVTWLYVGPSEAPPGFPSPTNGLSDLDQ